MTHFITILIFLLLAGCNYNPDGIKFGDTVKVKDGMYKNCYGRVIDEFSWILPCQHSFYIETLTCEKGYKSGTYVSVCEL